MLKLCAAYGYNTMSIRELIPTYATRRYALQATDFDCTGHLLSGTMDCTGGLTANSIGLTSGIYASSGIFDGPISCTTLTQSNPAPAPGAQDFSAFRRTTYSVAPGGLASITAVVWDQTQTAPAGIAAITTTALASDTTSAGGHFSLTTAGQSGLVLNSAATVSVETATVFDVTNQNGSTAIALLAPDITGGAVSVQNLLLATVTTNLVGVRTISASYTISAASGVLLVPRLVSIGGTGATLEIMHTTTVARVLHLG